MKILLVDDHPIFLEGLKNLLLAYGFNVIDTATSGEEALHKVNKLLPDVVLMDIIMKPMSGLQTTRLLKEKFPNVKIIMLTASETEEDLFEAVKSGASGYLLKSLNSHELSELLIKHMQGEPPIFQDLAKKMLQEFKKNDYAYASNYVSLGRNEINRLTHRQKEILTLVANGVKYKDIASMLYISERTVKYHIETIINKLHMENRSQAVKYIIQEGFVD